MIERNRTLDIAKGICLMCMILGHTFSWWNNAYPEFNMWVGPFFLVFFFIASGMCFKVRDTKEYIVKRLKRLLIPYAIYCAVYALFLTIIRKRFVGMGITQAIKTIFVSSIVALPAEFSDINFFHVDTYGVGPIWFLNCIFLSNVLYLILKSNKYRLIIWVGVAFAASVSQKYVILPFNIQDALIGCMFMSIGDVGKEYYEKYTNCLLKHKLIVNVLYVIPLALIYWLVITRLPYQWMNLGENIYHMESVLSTLLGIMLMTLCAVIVEQTKIIDDFVELYGRESMTILVLHGVDILMLRNWAMRDWAFVGSTILGYAFGVYLKKRINNLYNNFN